MTAYAAHMERLRSRVTAALDASLPVTPNEPSRLVEAMRYSLLPPGKCVRPILLLEYNRLGGGDEDAALPFACALEMLHCYSLIHDDLPCMDDDDTRRGRPANHKVFGEATALLAGSSLLSLVFETVLLPAPGTLLPSERSLQAARAIAHASGARGMAGGQAMDMIQAPDLDLLYARKTGALFVAAAESAACLSGADDERRDSFVRHARALGLAFQLADDLLDRDSDEYGMLRVRGASWCRERLESLTREALSALEGIPENAFLLRFTKELAAREA